MRIPKQYQILLNVVSIFPNCLCFYLLVKNTIKRTMKAGSSLDHWFFVSVLKKNYLDECFNRIVNRTFMIVNVSIPIAKQLVSSIIKMSSMPYTLLGEISRYPICHNANYKIISSFHLCKYIKLLQSPFEGTGLNGVITKSFFVVSHYNSYYC
jgi:hypothetical protein